MTNQAYELGRKKFDWWPDWDNECVAIVASGPSIKDTDLSLLRDRIHVIAIKAAIDLCPWAEVVYGCDAPWWNDRKGLPKFKGIKLFHGTQAAHWPDLKKVTINLRDDTMLVENPLEIGNGGNSGFQAINLAIQFGAKDIILVGYDAGAASNGELHWYGRNKWQGANNPQGSNFKRWKLGFEMAKKSIDLMGIEVVNCSPKTHLTTFNRASLHETMEAWGL